MTVRTKIADVFNNREAMTDTRITLCGWVRAHRSCKGASFIELNDGSRHGSIQIVYDASLSNHSAVSTAGVGASLRVTGMLVKSEGPGQSIELKAETIIIEGLAEGYPLQKKRHSFEFLRENAHLRPRTNTFNAVFRVRGMVCFAIHKFFNERGFVYVNTPIITSGDCEGAGAMFTVSADESEHESEKGFFGNTARLTVSGQLNAECYALAFSDVYTFGPTFRAENSNTTRHAAEFWMLEPEMAFADLDDDISLAEDMLKYITDYVLKNAEDELAFLNKYIDGTLSDRLVSLLREPFARITYTDAVKTLENSRVDFTHPVYWGANLKTEHERYLTETVFKKPVFVTDYPKGIKAFYMRRNDDGKTVAAVDLLVPGVGELIGGSQREERMDILLAAMEEAGLDISDYSWYTDLRRFGSCKHAGFGLGLERLIMFVTGMTNIRDCIPFPRTVGSAAF